jgi:hypothetical protein
MSSTEAAQPEEADARSIMRLPVAISLAERRPLSCGLHLELQRRASREAAPLNFGEGREHACPELHDGVAATQGPRHRWVQSCTSLVYLAPVFSTFPPSSKPRHLLRCSSDSSIPASR